MKIYRPRESIQNRKDMSRNNVNEKYSKIHSFFPGLNFKKTCSQLYSYAEYETTITSTVLYKYYHYCRLVITTYTSALSIFFSTSNHTILCAITLVCMITEQAGDRVSQGDVSGETPWVLREVAGMDFSVTISDGTPADPWLRNAGHVC